jgi:hypothetical protein
MERLLTTAQTLEGYRNHVTSVDFLPRLDAASISVARQHGQDLGRRQRRVPTDA